MLVKTYVEKLLSEKTHDNPQTRPIRRTRTLPPYRVLRRPVHLDHRQHQKINHPALNRRVRRRPFLSLARRQDHRPMHGPMHHPTQPPAPPPRHRRPTPRDQRRHLCRRRLHNHRLQERRLRRSRRHRARIPAHFPPRAGLPRADLAQVRLQHHSQLQSTVLPYRRLPRRRLPRRRLPRRHLCPARHTGRPHPSSPTRHFNAEPPPRLAPTMQVRATTCSTHTEPPRRHP